MDESLAGQSSSAVENPPTPPGNFWHKFRLFPSPLDESGFKYWYIYIYGPLALAFFFPLWGIHREMVRQKELYEDRFAVSQAKMRQKLWSSIDADAFDEARTIRRQLNILYLLHPDTLDYPTWPFSRRLLALYLVPQILPLLSLVLPLFMRH